MTGRSDTVPENEKPVFEKLTALRQQLSVIKKDHSKFMNSKEIAQIYHSVLAQTEILKKIRGNPQLTPDTETNKVDVLVDEIFQLLSLCFVTCGLSNTAPATYASLSTVQRLLEHLNESAIYTPHDLKPIKDRLDEISTIIKSTQNQDNDDDDEVVELNSDISIPDKTNTEINLLKNKLDLCYNEYNHMMQRIDDLSTNVKTLMDDLLDIKYKLFKMITEDIHDDDKIELLAKDLNQCKIKAETIFSNNPNENGSGLIKGLIDNCSNYLKDLQLGVDRVDPHLSQIYEELLKLKSILENLLLTKRWTLRTTDIFNYQKQLIEIDNSRVNGYFISKDYKGQSVLLYLLRSCFAIIYKLLESSEPVSESLQPIHNQLSTIRRCLLDLKRMGGISSIRELYPYQLKLDSIDNMKVDGKFVIQGQIPEGQATVTALLAECFDIVHELKIEYYDRDESLEFFDDTVKPRYSVIGTKASHDSNYDYNHSDNEEDNERSNSNANNEILDDELNRSITKDLGTLDYNDESEDLPSYANSICDSIE
ncbi:hypothetical protein CANINC_002861 [Pichia inconspicua]|uniref:Uncharacterized protein n=1 Tax=Pichia inconspicua TaxID=52247 RepID=A0A4T0X057_9ASCO|nr:hypothetical protein CANINC_002861 [[Candida] inconspicua]